MASIVPWRGREVSRIEGFSDAVFGFALTLLVVSLEVPRSFTELAEIMRGFVAFAFCFAVVLWIWYEHNLFFRQYGLQDAYTVFLNGVLLFVVLFYVYPLKFLFTMLVVAFTGIGPADLLGRGLVWHQVPILMLIYSSGFVVLFLVFVLLYSHAHRRRADLDLDPLERFDLKARRTGHLLNAGVGVISILMALLFFRKPGQSHWAGWVYCLLGPIHGTYWTRVARRRQRLAAQAPA